MLALALALLAVPPTLPFPAATRPVDGSALPANGRVVVFGSDPVSLASVGASLTLDGVAVDASMALLGCCSVEVTPRAPLDEGEAVLAISTADGDATYRFTVVGADATAPVLGAPEVVQVVTATGLAAPIRPSAGPAWVIILDVPDVDDDVGVAALVTYDADDPSGAIVTIEPTASAAFERLITGVAGAGRTEACVVVEVRDYAGSSTRAAPVCAPLPPHDVVGDEDRPTPPGAGGCTAGAAPPALALLALLALLVPRRGRRTLGAALALALVTTACAGRDPPVATGTLCDDAFVDRTAPGAAFSDAFFDDNARYQYGWEVVKGLVLEPMRPDATRVAFFTGDAYALHDEWFYFRLVNGRRACGALEIAPLDGLAFDTVADVQAWARTLDRLPPFLSWQDERLYAPDFYRLSRDTTPRVYMPFYVTRDVEGEPRAYTLRFAGADVPTRDDLVAAFRALDPFMPDGAPLYWTPSPRREAHTGLARDLERQNDPLAARVRWR